jgi:hypothetical protein
METVMAIPLFLVLFGGIFWVGDLILARDKLVVADRYAAWNAGNRHRLDKGGIQGEIQDNFFDPNRVGDQPVEGIDYEAGPLDFWSTPFGATVRLKVVMPIWTRGWLSSSDWAGEGWTGARIPQEEVRYTGRAYEAVPATSHHVVYMRTLYGTMAHRTWEPIELADKSRPWDGDVARSPWAMDGSLGGTSPGGLVTVPAPPNPPAGYEHDRHDRYEDWSI